MLTTVTATHTQSRVRISKKHSNDSTRSFHFAPTDWSIWTAGLVTTTAVRDLLISSVRKYAADGKSSQPLGDWYETTDGSVEGFRARPVVGGHLALVCSLLCYAPVGVVLTVARS